MSQDDRPAPPNFLVFVLDQISAMSLACNGNPDVLTPHIDRLAREGLSFTRAYCNNSVCMPSRSTILTGLTPRQHGCITNGTLLPAHIPTVTGALAEAGYRTHAVGKLHLQPFSTTSAPGEPIPSWESRPLWDEGRITRLPLPYYGFQSVNYVGGHVHYCFGDYTNWLNAHHPGMHALYARERAYSAAGQSWKMDLPAELHYNHWIADRTIDFLRAAPAEQPFLLFCSFPDPHHPFAACRPYSEQFDPASLSISPTWDTRDEPCAWLNDVGRPSPDFNEADLRADVAQYYGMIAHIDDNIGRVLDTLRHTGQDDNTVVVLIADHGEYLGSHHLLYKHVWPWEELLRVPFVWRAPSEASQPASVVPQPAGGVSQPPDGVSPSAGSEAVVSLLDFAPTVLDYAGVDQGVLNQRGPEARADWPGLPGRSLRPAIDQGTPLSARPAISELDSDWQPGPMLRRRTIVDGHWKLTVFPQMGEGMLHNLADDPHETHNLWHDPGAASVKADLTTRLLEELIWSDPLPGPRICGA
jgi:arylsulfatase A-like enzyme